MSDNPIENSGGVEEQESDPSITTLDGTEMSGAAADRRSAMSEGSGAYGDRLTAVHMADARPGHHPTSGYPTLPNHAVQKIKENIVCEPAAARGDFVWEAGWARKLMANIRKRIPQTPTTLNVNSMDGHGKIWVAVSHSQASTSGVNASDSGFVILAALIFRQNNEGGRRRYIGSGAYGDRLTAVHMADARPGHHPTSGYPTLPNHAVQKIKENIVCEPAAARGDFVWEAVRDAAEREVKRIPQTPTMLNVNLMDGHSKIRVAQSQPS
ncbi:hypothetical protein B0H13DRAFT_1922505 [Mycena leptocephala]|nr:hypothetical protein B0H13DRAFT_1922505 [Mycena leptocephala]